MNQRVFLTFLILAHLICSLSAQELQLSGYYENQFFPQELNNKLILQDYNKIRLDLSAEIGDNITFNGDYIYRVFHGKTTFNAFDFVPESVVQEISNLVQTPVDSLRSLFDFQIENENFLDNAYVTFYSRRLNVRVGKQQLPWGTGYTWNPTDIFNEKNLLDPTYEKVGVNAFKLEIPFGSEGMVTGIFGIGEDMTSSTKALKIKQHAHGYDFSASYVEKEQAGFDYMLALKTAEKRRLVGGDFSGQLFGLGVWGEGAYNFLESSADFGQYLLGLDYTFESELYLIGEYYRNELGKSNKGEYTFNDWMRLLSAEGENLGQDYLFLGQRYPITELWNWANYLLFNLNDKSGIFFPWFDYSLNDNTELMFVGYLPFGGKESEFGEFGMGGFARVRVYF
ncbi:MAG: hypothetical protein ACE5HI_09105 [bacterium]